MLTFSRSGVKVFEISRTGVTIGELFDSFYGIDGSHGRRFVDGMQINDGFKVWIGRRFLVIECPPLARLIESLFTPPAAAA